MLEYAKSFSHIYVEEGAWAFPLTRQILEKFPGRSVIPIRHYKDVFNRKRQDYAVQHRVKPLILAVKKDGFFYPGAPVCQDFGNSHFYYSSCIMNCPFDCEYCYLKGMYPSGCMVIFVNLQDYFREASKILKRHPMYVCVSYDSDLPAAESLTGYVKAWSDFTGGYQECCAQDKDHAADPGQGGQGILCSQPVLMTEIRTKSAGLAWENLHPWRNVIYAFTLSPQPVIDAYEHDTPSLETRLSCIREGLMNGFPIRLCFDPMIYLSGWRQVYLKMLEQVSAALDLSKIRDASIGTFRISAEYLSALRRMEPESPVALFPYIRKGEYCQYDEEVAEEMQAFLYNVLSKYLKQEQIFCWE